MTRGPAAIFGGRWLGGRWECGLCRVLRCLCESVNRSRSPGYDCSTKLRGAESLRRAVAPPSPGPSPHTHVHACRRTHREVVIASAQCRPRLPLPASHAPRCRLQSAASLRSDRGHAHTHTPALPASLPPCSRHRRSTMSVTSSRTGTRSSRRRCRTGWRCAARSGAAASRSLWTCSDKPT